MMANIFVALLECLAIYGPQASVGVQICYRGYGSPLVLMLQENHVLTDCGLRTLEVASFAHFDIRAADLHCRAIVQSATLRDALAELEWGSNGVLTLEVAREYLRLSVSAAGAACVVEIPRDSEAVELLDCSAPVRVSYRMKLLLPCLKALSAAVKTQVRVNAVGLLSMQHLLQSDTGCSAFVDYFVVPREDDDESD